ncbi:hypothetical protein CASFOL_040577 [Castilleja foliolosa]|uniref:snRNA-activating protein complex subunit 3 n=1 Tax=Castilleja foliolosa TaxID=1961234 RepID=A0ABD3BC03_9LAMI
MLLGRDDGGEDLYVSIPLGGPIYVHGSIGPLTKVSDFAKSVSQELKSLKDELSVGSLDTCDEEISVDELKIITEDELVNKAFEEAFKDGEFAMDASQVRVEKLSPKSDEKTDDNSASGLELGLSQNPDENSKALVSSGTSDAVPLKTCSNKKSNKKPPGRREKRKRNNNMNSNFDENYLVKVEQLARIKQKQEDDKAAVRLHSFDGSREHVSGPHMKAEKIKSLKSGSVSTKVKASNPSDGEQVKFPETVLSVEVYHKKEKRVKKTQEFLVLGQQFLSELKDKIYCLTDEIMKKTSQYDPSGYFLIEDVFYNDMRKSSAIDYSKPILNWLQNSKDDALEKWEFIVSGGKLQQKQKDILGIESKHKLPMLRSLHMQGTRFCNLKIRLGAGYLYCHQGNCKHIIVIRDMRLLHPEDVQSQSAYPLITFQSKIRYKKCSVCKIYRAEKMTVDDKWAPSNPCYFCDVCYYMLHYADGSLLYSDFNVYDYFHE